MLLFCQHKSFRFYWHAEVSTNEEEEEQKLTAQMKFDDNHKLNDQDSNNFTANSKSFSPFTTTRS